jgi:hypothetical protein
MGGTARTFQVRHLSSGGLITNYYCTSRCAHYLYCCSPQWEKRYIDETTARRNKACRVARLAAFPWVSDFYRELDAFDPGTTHRLQEYQERFGRITCAGFPPATGSLGGPGLEDLCRCL